MLAGTGGGPHGIEVLAEHEGCEPAGEEDRQSDREQGPRHELAPQAGAAAVPRRPRTAPGTPEGAGGHRRARFGAPVRPAGRVHGAAMPAGSAMRATVPWPGRELTLIVPSYLRARWPASARPMPIDSSWVV